MSENIRAHEYQSRGGLTAARRCRTDRALVVEARRLAHDITIVVEHGGDPQRCVDALIRLFLDSGEQRRQASEEPGS